MPFFTPSVTSEADAAFTYLTQQCTQLKLTALDLTDEQARSTPTASGLSVSGLIVHGAQVVNNWLIQVKEPTREVGEDDYRTVNEKLGLTAMFDGSALPDLDITEAVAIFDEVIDGIEDARAAVDDAGTDLGTEVPMPYNPWMPNDFTMTVRWILWHLAAEIARHAGHADIIRESIDGAIAYQLNAQADGEPWPPESTDWS